MQLAVHKYKWISQYGKYVHHDKEQYHFHDLFSAVILKSRTVIFIEVHKLILQQILPSDIHRSVGVFIHQLGENVHSGNVK